MTFAAFISSAIGAGIFARFLTGWVVAGVRMWYRLVDSVMR